MKFAFLSSDTLKPDKFSHDNFALLQSFDVSGALSRNLMSGF